MIEKKVKINVKGSIDIKTAAKFSNVANRYPCEVWLIKDDVEVNGKSILGLISLALTSGDEIIIKTIGEDETGCADELSKIIG